MYAVEFRAKVKNGTIEIPSQYRDKLKKVVRVIVLAEMEESTNNLIDQLLETPFRIKGFEPLSRNEIYLQGDMNHAQYSMGYRS
jgi:hypothetical protein